MPKILSFISGFILLIIVTAGAIYYRQRDHQPAPLNHYRHERYGLAFAYPPGYTLAEAEVGTAEREHYQISLIRSEAAQLPEAGEGPTAITIEIYQNNLDRQSLEDWLTNTSASNFKLSDGRYATTTLAGAPALSYHWSGLYEAEASALSHRDNIIVATVTFIAPTDAIRSDYQTVLDSLQLF